LCPLGTEVNAAKAKKWPIASTKGEIKNFWSLVSTSTYVVMI